MNGCEYFIRSISAPMHLSRTGELCTILRILPGTTLTLGRSKKICDLVFQDTRVSRKHCELRLTPAGDSLILFNGVTVPGSSHPTPHRKDSDGDELGTGDCSFQPSLNGIFVNGHQLVRKSMILKFGDEVSLVGPTDSGRSLEPGCELAVGFTVESWPTLKKRRALPSESFSQVVTELDGITTFERVSTSPALQLLNVGISFSSDCHSQLNASTRKQHLDIRSESTRHLNTYDCFDGRSANEFCYSNQSTHKAKSQSLGRINKKDERSVFIKHSDDLSVEISGNHGTVNQNIRNAQKATNSLGDIESKILSTFNLVQASIRLRTTLLSDLKGSIFVHKECSQPEEKHLGVLRRTATGLSNQRSGDSSSRGRDVLTVRSQSKSSSESMLIDHKCHFKAEGKIKHEATETVIFLADKNRDADSVTGDLYQNNDKGLQQSKRHRTMASIGTPEFIRKEKLLKPLVKDYLLEEPSTSPVILSETNYVSLRDQHCCTKFRDALHGDLTKPEINSCCNGCHNRQVAIDQSEGAVLKVSIAEPSKATCPSRESVQSLQLDEVEFYDDALVYSETGKDGTTEKEKSNKFLGFFFRKNRTNQTKVIPEIAFDSRRRNSNTVVTEFHRKEQSTCVSNELESVSDSSQVLHAVSADSSLKLSTTGCRTDANGEQDNKKNHDHSEIYMELTHCQWERDCNTPLKMHESFCRNSMRNPQVSEPGTSMTCNSGSFGYFLNTLSDIPDGLSKSISLEDLLAPIDDIKALLITTFTYDVEWFMSFSGISKDIPITVVCHHAQRCFSSVVEDHCEKPYLDWPNVTLVYPPFSKVSSFGKGQGIGCHHPKVFLQVRTKSIRMVISSANLSFKQWFHVTNNVWWQDFPRYETPDFYTLFRHDSNNIADFASQVAIFLAHLLENAPSEAHWVTDLAAFDFSLATGFFIASVPGVHQRFYENSSQNLEDGSCILGQHYIDHTHRNLGIVHTTVAGVKYRFCPAADRNGSRIRSLAAVLNAFKNHNCFTMQVLLKRVKYLQADPNAVSVVVTTRELYRSQDLFLEEEDLLNTDMNTLDSNACQCERSFVKLGFLRRDIASWVALLCDKGFLSFAACVSPIEALAVASGKSDESLKLALYVFEGPKFSSLSTTLTNEELVAFCGLFRSLHNTWGIWRMQEVLSRYSWIDSHETDFFVASSSIGTSLDAKFLAAFAAAAGRRTDTRVYSQDSDPEWGCWTAEHEAANPSIRIVFPTINRVKQNLSNYGLLCFAESAWLRLKPLRLLHDAIPYPPERESFPMHVKVARRRFQESSTSRPYGWLYCGSHNFSPAAWGRPACKVGDSGSSTMVLGSSLHISNYEFGIIFVEAPYLRSSENAHDYPDKAGLDKFIMPFKLPPPVYSDTDQPATSRAMMEVYLELRKMELKAVDATNAAILPDKILVEDVNFVQEQEVGSNYEEEETKAEERYIEALWSQIEEEKG